MVISNFSVIINGYLLRSYQWLSRVINVYQLVISGYQWLLVINKLSVVEGY